MPAYQLNGFNLYYERSERSARSGPGTAVVYIHGGFASLASRMIPPDSYAWDWENDFAAHFDFVEYERRGCFRSACPDSGYDIPTQTADLEALLDHLQIPSAHLVGSSAGGPIALLFAATRPRRVRSLTLAGSSLKFFRPGNPVTEIVTRLGAILEQEGAQAAFTARPEGVETNFGILWELEEMKTSGMEEAYLARQKRDAARAATLSTEVRLRHFAAELRKIGRASCRERV